ncbi:MAG: polysulfide reductase NrfD [Geothrix sp.]|jgi:formate-dependent nitrite reductase membrane component NrfD|uniref:Polysulfide reductase NrfD n=1 Tax=Candidatus Geothrix odensensis TaxID=2954440 RepID=A0A936F3W8_9BACT|nr:polysulfide reductase NrfD [Candidatus Geothrix odensensis]MCC6512700.1 polysulfide reductase NrfD [Geothrix sp.]
MHEPVWEFLIVNYLFLGGLSAGLYFVSGLAAWFQEDGQSAFPRLARWGALLAPWPVSLGSVLLIFDLGKPLRFWKLFFHFRWQSPMSIGSWLLVLFTLVSLVNLWAWLEQGERQGLLARIPEAIRSRIPARIRGYLDRDASAWRRTLAMAGFPLAVGVGIYTGVLLGAVQARPFWNTNLVAQMFLFSALSSGAATILLVRLLDKEAMDLKEVRFLYTLDIVLISLEFFIVLPYLIHGELSVLAVREALALILGGPYTLVFWGLFLGAGLLVPLAIEIYEFKPLLTGKGTFHLNPRLAMTAASLVIIGGYTLRYVFVFAGQASGFR